MRSPIPYSLACVLGLTALLTSAWAAAPAALPLISSNQIDRFEAIRLLQKSLERNPSALADWVILGELAHEVALDAPPDMAQHYYRMSRDAYQKALALGPRNPGLKAAVRFAQEQVEGASRFDAARKVAAQTYIEARRRDLAATNYMPAIRTFLPPRISTAAATTVPVTTPAPVATLPDVIVSSTAAAVATPPLNPPTNAVVLDTNPAITPARTRNVNTASYGTHLIYSNPIYLPYTIGGVPYTYQQYVSSYYPYGYYSNQNIQPVTLPRYTQMISAASRNLRTPVPVEAPGSGACYRPLNEDSSYGVMRARDRAGREPLYLRPLDEQLWADRGGFRCKMALNQALPNPTELR